MWVLQERALHIDGHFPNPRTSPHVDSAMDGQEPPNYVNMDQLHAEERPPHGPQINNDWRHVTGPLVRATYDVGDTVEVLHGIWHAGVVISADSGVRVKTTVRRIDRGVGGRTFDYEIILVILKNQLTEFIRPPIIYYMGEQVELHYNKMWVGGSIVAEKKDAMTVQFDISSNPETIEVAYLNPAEIRNLVRKIDSD